MLAEDLVALAAAHGIDLKGMAGASAPNKGFSVRHRKRSADEIRNAQGRPLYDSAHGRESRVFRYPAWSHADAGHAAFGVPRMPWLAAQLSWAGDQASYAELHRGLLLETIHLAERFNWPLFVASTDGAPHTYFAELATLVLDEDRHQSLFHAEPRLYAWACRVEEPVWRHKLFERFDRVKCCYQLWLETARGIIQRRLRHDEVVDEAI